MKSLQFLLLLITIFKTVTLAESAHADELKTPEIRWESRLIDIQNDQIKVKLMLLTGNCISPPIECDSIKTDINNGLSVSGSGTSGVSLYESAGEEMAIPDMQGKTLSVGQDVDVWIGDIKAYLRYASLHNSR